MSKPAKKPFYITTTLPYVNAEPHIGHALEFIRADIVARAKKIAGYDVFFNTGTDEHGIKIYQKAKQLHQEPQAYVDAVSASFCELLPKLGISSDVNFIRTTDEHHEKAAREFWRLAEKNGLIYKKNYQIKYCVGCELEKTESELVDGRCPLHPLQEIELYEEENYFFRFSLYQKPLLDLYEKRPDFVVPRARLNEIQAFVERGLEDFSISRLASKMPWGIPVPGDPLHVMYVWFDALVNYVAAIGWPDDSASFEKWWVQSGGVVQYCGKDNLRQQSAMWQAMLMSVKLPPSRQIIIDGFVTGEGGVKMSKSLGNTVDPLDLVKDYGTDALRYYVARELHPFEDSPFTNEKFKEAYNAHLANGLGNLVNRVLKLTGSHGIKVDLPGKSKVWNDASAAVFRAALEAFDLQKAAGEIWQRISTADKEIQETAPFKLLKSEVSADKSRGVEVMTKLYGELWGIAVLLEPFMPVTAEKIQAAVQANQMPETPLFMRK